MSKQRLLKMTLQLQNNFWVLRQNYGEKTNQEQMRNLIISQKIVTCPWGGWGVARENVINGQYNESTTNRPGGRPSKNQDRRFVEEMKIGDIVLIPFAKKRGCIVGRIASGVEYSIDTGMFWTEKENHITIGEEGDLPFRPVGRYIEIIKEDLLPETIISNRLTLSKMSQRLIESLNK